MYFERSILTYRMEIWWKKKLNGFTSAETLGFRKTLKHSIVYFLLMFSLKSGDLVARFFAPTSAELWPIDTNLHTVVVTQ